MLKLRFFFQLHVVCFAVLLPCVAAAQDLVSVARSGDVETLREVLPAGSQPDPGKLVKPLYYASQRGHAEVVRYLLSLGANPDSATTFGTSLGIAARNNHTDIVTALLAAGADPNLRGGEYKLMPLHQAAERGSIEAARLLLDHGADVDARDRIGWPAIQYAGYKDRTEMVAFLREMGAGPASVEPLRPGELEAADLEEGRVLAIECGGCHGMAPGEIGLSQEPGPTLVGVVGRTKASLEGFPYSKAMQAQTGRWTTEDLNVFLADPFNVVPGTAMPRGGQPDRVARVAIIAYLAHLRP